MKNVAVLGLLVASILVSGCVRKQYVVVTPDQINARVKQNQKTAEQIAVMQIAEEMAEAAQQEKWKKRVGLSCPIGGYEQVKIYPTLGQESIWLKGPLRGAIRRTTYVLKAKNSEDGTIDIEGPGGMWVGNLCAKGSVHLVKSLEGSELGFWGVRTVSDSYSASIQWTAGGVTSKNVLGYVESQRGVLYTQSWEQRQDATWLIKLKNENGKFF